MPAVTVVMNCYNGEKYLREAIDSVYEQTFEDWEIVFWDNQSTDDTAEIAKSYGGNMRYFRAKEFLPLGAARNKALQEARGNYIAFLDCDDIWLPEKLKIQVQLIESDSENGLVYCDTYKINAEGAFTGKWSDGARMKRGFVFEDLLDGDFVAFSTTLIRKKVFDDIGYFNPQYSILEDYDLILRIAEKYRMDYIDTPLAKFRIHEGSTYKKTDALYSEMWALLDEWLTKRPELMQKNMDKVTKARVRLYAQLFYFYWQKMKVVNSLAVLRDLFAITIHTPVNAMRAIIQITNELLHRRSLQN